MFPFDILFSQKQPVICPYCFKIIKDKRATKCTHEECGKEFPHEYVRWRSPFIAVIGAASSGKSHYIATLIQRINELAARKHHTNRFDWCMSSADDNTRKKYNDIFRKPLYDEISLIDKTSQKQDATPLLYYMRTPSYNYITLTFFDTAGEHFDAQAAMKSYTPYVCNASGIILLLDPLQQKEMRTKLSEQRRKTFSTKSRATASGSVSLHRRPPLLPISRNSIRNRTIRCRLGNVHNPLTQKRTMTKILIIAALIDLNEPDEQEPPVPAPKPFSPDTLLRLLSDEVRKEHNPDICKNINRTFFKAVFISLAKTRRA